MGNMHRHGPTTSASTIEFVDRAGACTGTGPGERAWRITHTYTGWRLEFLDPGDVRATYAGTHASLDAAQREANCVYRGLSPQSPRGR